jgi:alkane 1-monooxygenase
MLVVARFRKYLAPMFFISLALPLGAMKIIEETGLCNLGPWLFFTFITVFLVLLDQCIGVDQNNPLDDGCAQKGQNSYFSLLAMLCLPAAILLSIYSAIYLSTTHQLNWGGRIVWTISLGLCTTGLALCPGHWLFHRESITERLIGTFLFAMLCNAAYKIDHLRSHHVNVATPVDNGTAAFNQSLYHFMWQAIPKTFLNAWNLETERLERHGYSALSWRNEMISWHFISIGLAVLFYIFFGYLGLFYFIGQGMTALAAHNTINYIQHYGLTRRKSVDGRYERFNHNHAWNSNHLLSNILSLQLPRHADHHLHPNRHYQFLEHIEQSPKMPMGYFGMFLMALVPPLWFHVMNPLVKENQVDLSKLPENLNRIP